jgi:hypothetical protein
MERDRPKALLLILLTFFGVAAYGDILYHPEEIRSGSFGLVIYHNPQGFWEDRDWEVYDLFSETYRDSLRGKTLASPEHLVTRALRGAGGCSQHLGPRRGAFDHR